MKKGRIISYRRRCKKTGTGLSHYITVIPKKVRDEKDTASKDKA